MIGYILTTDQKNSIQNKMFSDAECFNCVQDINGVWFNFVTEQQIALIAPTEFVWVLTVPQGEYVPPPPPPFPS